MGNTFSFSHQLLSCKVQRVVVEVRGEAQDAEQRDQRVLRAVNGDGDSIDARQIFFMIDCDAMKSRRLYCRQNCSESVSECSVKRGSGCLRSQACLRSNGQLARTSRPQAPASSGTRVPGDHSKPGAGRRGRYIDSSS